MYRELLFVVPFLISMYACQAQEGNTDSLVEQGVGADSTLSESLHQMVDTGANTLGMRFTPPQGFTRVPADSGSFASYLRSRPLKPHGAKVDYYNGSQKRAQGVYCAVLDQDIGTKDLHQCADAVMLLKAEYHWTRNDFDAIHFHFTNGERADYAKYAKGYRVSFSNGTQWSQRAQVSYDYKTFRKYMELIWSYCGTLSLSRELEPVADHEQMQVGDVFIWGGSPGHAVLVVDMAENADGEKVFMLAQSYMPAQQTQILINPNDESISPWYRVSDIGSRLDTPEWTFDEDALMRFSW